MAETGRGKGNTKKRRMTAAEFESVLPHLSGMSDDRIKAARAALVDNVKLVDVGKLYGWQKQGVGSAVNIVWKIFQRVKESLRVAEEEGVRYSDGSPDLPDGWKRVTLDAPEYLIEIFKAEIEKARRLKDSNP